jgi:ribosomal protein S18 acetylase RimI-like enzyme
MVGKLAELHESWDVAKYPYLPHVAEMYRGWLASRATDARAVFLVAEREAGKIVGFLVGTVEREIPIYRVEEFGFIHDVWVDPDYRHEGVGRQMTMLAIERFKEIGVKQIRLDTAAKNDAARKLFASCGFRTSVVEMLIEI